MSNATAASYPLSGPGAGMADPWCDPASGTAHPDLDANRMYLAGSGKRKFPDEGPQRSDQIKEEWAEAKQKGENPYADFEAAQKAAYDKSRAGKMGRMLSFGKKKDKANDQYTQLDDSASVASGTGSVQT